MKPVKIALAVCEGRLVPPTKAERGREYCCRDCKKLLVVKKGNIRRHHFAHKVEEGSCGGGMGNLHKLAQEWVKQCIDDHLRDGCPAPKFLVKCRYCKTERTHTIPRDSSEVEIESPFGQGRKLDVAVLSAGRETLFGIGILDKSPVKEDKEQELNRTGLRWVELDAEATVWSGEPHWDSRRSSPLLLGCSCRASKSLWAAARVVGWVALGDVGVGVLSFLLSFGRKQRKK